MNVLGTINITEKQMAFKKKPNCKFTCAQVVHMFYRVLSSDRNDWRHILRYVNKKLVRDISVRSDARNSEYPVCMIAGDTDMPKTGRKGEWKALLSTGTSLTPFKAYQIYSMRWAIEVVFYEGKSLLKLGKCQCRDFGSQIASISLNMLQSMIR